MLESWQATVGIQKQVGRQAGVQNAKMQKCKIVKLDTQIIVDIWFWNSTPKVRKLQDNIFTRKNTLEGVVNSKSYKDAKEHG